MGKFNSLISPLPPAEETPKESGEMNLSITGIGLNVGDEGSVEPKEDSTSNEFLDDVLSSGNVEPESINLDNTDNPEDSIQSSNEPFNYGFSDLVPSIAQHLHSRGLLQHIPEDVNVEEFGMDEYEKTLEYNYETLKQQSFEEGAVAMQNDMLGRLNPFAQRVLQFNIENPNASSEELKALATEIAASDYLQSLTPEENSNEIVREYYRSDGWSEQDINEKIDRLIQSDSLSSEAKILKPKLDRKAEQIAAARMQEEQLVKQYEAQRLVGLQDKVVEKLTSGTINGLPITREDAKFLYSAILNEDAKVNLGNRSVRMGYAEAIMRQQKYEGNIENVMLSLLVLKDGLEGVNRYYSQIAKNKEVEKAVKEIKFGRKRKSSNNESTPSFNSSLNTGLKFNIPKNYT